MHIGRMIKLYNQVYLQSSRTYFVQMMKYHMMQNKKKNWKRILRDWKIKSVETHAVPRTYLALMKSLLENLFICGKQKFPTEYVDESRGFHPCIIHHTSDIGKEIGRVYERKLY